MRNIIMIVLVVLFSSCATGKYATQPNSRPTWLEGRRVAVCADGNYRGVVAAMENALRQMHGAVIVYSDCRNISGIDYLAMLEVVQSGSEAEVWLRIIGNNGSVTHSHGESKSFYVSGFAAGRKNYAEAAVTSSRNQHDQLRSAAEDAARNLQ